MTSRRLDYVLLIGGVLLAWQVLHQVAGDNAVSAPIETIRRALALLQSRDFWENAASTGKAFVLATLIGCAAGLVLGLWLGFRRFAGDVADPILGTLYSIPKITLYPIILLIFGLGMPAKIAFGVIHGIFPIAIFTMNAVRNVAPIYHRTGKAMRLSAVATAMTILAPAALPEMLTGIRIGVALTLLGTLIGEFFSGTTGIGVALTRAMDVHSVVDILALTLLIFMFAASINTFLHLIERRARHNG